MSDPIAQLNDAAAARLLATEAERLDGTPDPALLRALAALPRDAEGELSRTALQLLAADPAQGEVVRALAAGPAPERFLEPVTGAALLVAAVMVLQTHGRLELKDGKWSFLLEKKPTDTSLVKALVEKLCGLLGLHLGS